ncbi:MAG: hypothetical protein KAW17_04300 [Candidatus Eisenbacteria sp.]|nr:hypothetical protein [Candidatus Eisenbacteria bacterium]
MLISWIGDVRSKLKTLDQSRRALVRFGRTMAVALVVLGALVFIFGSHPQRGYWLAGIGAVFFLLSRMSPAVLRPVQKGWMTFAFALGWIMSRLLLTVLFLVAITPTGLILRLIGRDPLEIRSEKDSYWIRREKEQRPRERYERLF